MSIPTRPAVSFGVSKLDPIVCASAAARLLWTIGALLLLWMAVLWALD